MDYQKVVNEVSKQIRTSRQNSIDAIDSFIELMSVKLDESERKTLADNLPERLADIIYAVLPSGHNYTKRIVDMYAENMQLDTIEAARWIRSVWLVLEKYLPMDCRLIIDEVISSDYLSKPEAHL